MSISGSVPAYSYHGVPAGGSRLASIDGARIAPPSGPYVGRGNKCVANDDTCEGMRAKGTEYCMGHLRQVTKTKGEDKQEVAGGV